MSADESKKPNTKSMLAKIMETIRTESISLRDAVMESTGFNQFERQIETAKINLDEAKHTLSEQMANELQTSRLVKILADKVNQQELLIIDALGQGDEDHAFKLATEMVELEQDLLAQQQIKKSHELHLRHLTRQVENAERLLKDLERQLSMVNTTEQIHQATDVITKNFDQADSKLLSAKTSLDRIRRKQRHVDEQYDSTEISQKEQGSQNTIEENSESKTKLNTNQAEDVIKRVMTQDKGHEQNNAKKKD